jgi:aminoglycoside phosphotransferase family enzyme/predicted kinase
LDILSNGNTAIRYRRIVPEAIGKLDSPNAIATGLFGGAAIAMRMPPCLGHGSRYDASMTTEPDHESIVRWLERPEAYAHHPERVEHIQTHISHVFLAGPHAFKLKKPVKYDFLDFSTIECREQACRNELRLNRRLAADSYLGVVPITRDFSGGLQLGGKGPAIDWLVHMRRLPTELTLEALHRRGELRTDHIDRLADRLSGFYHSLAPVAMTPAEYCERCCVHVRGNRRELMAVKHHLPRSLVERIHGFQLQLLLLRPGLFEERVRLGRIVEGHGDLRPEHICLGEPVTIFDCIEFSADFRRLDVADELAFLVAECDFLGAHWVGPCLLQAYQDRSGDQPPAVLLDYYKSYRACVRAKVAALRADQLQGAEREASAAQAARHLAFADKYASPWVRPLVLVVGGLAGTGKTTLASALADALGAELLRTDTIRHKLFGPASHAADVDEGIYTQESRDTVYDDLFRQAAALAGDRISVVLDGTFSTTQQLRKAEALAANSMGMWLAIECVCPPEVAHQRIGRRLAESRDASDAHLAVHAAQRSRWESWPAELPQITIDTTTPLNQQVQRVIRKAASLPETKTTTPGLV